ncbi:MAG: hypothetical protein WD403_11505 [Pirellulales bacterium]
MSEINPYASPLSDEQAGTIPAEPGGVWRDGPLLVMRRDAVLPDLCIKCNLPAGGRRLMRTLYWHHPLVYLSLLLWVLCGPLPFIVLALALRRKAKVAIGVCTRHLARRRRAILIGWTASLLGIALFVAGVLQSGDLAGLLILAGVLLVLCGVVYGVSIAAVISPKRIEAEYVFIKRAGPEYLAQFPAWRLAASTSQAAGVD